MNIRGRISIVIVHGIVGNNRIFDFLGPLVPKDCLVKYVVLDGHGGDALAFSRTSMEVWRRQVAEAVMEVADVCGRVVGVGHSMGCLLLLNPEVRSQLTGLFLLNPPLRIRLRRGLLTNALKVAFGLTEGDLVALAAIILRMIERRYVRLLRNFLNIYHREVKVWIFCERN